MMKSLYTYEYEYNLKKSEKSESTILWGEII